MRDALLPAVLIALVASPALATVIPPLPAVPEPTAVALFAAGAAVVAIGIRLRRRQ